MSGFIDPNILHYGATISLSMYFTPQKTLSSVPSELNINKSGNDLKSSLEVSDQNNDNDEEENKGNFGFLSVKGFAVKGEDKYKYMRCGFSTDPSLLSNFDEALFLICKGNVYTEKKKYKRIKGNKTSDNKAIIDAQKKKKELEEEENETEEKKAFGKPVLYGEKIELKHIKTGKYLTVIRTSSLLEKECLKISLSSGDKRSHWTFKPRFTFRVEGEPVRFSDKVILYSEKTKHVIHVSRYSYLKPLVFNDNRLEVNASSHIENTLQSSIMYRDDVVWKIRLYRYCLPNEGSFLKGGDLIRLLHKDISGGIYFDHRQRKVCEHVALKLNRGTSSKSILSVFQVEAFDTTRGGITYFGMPLRLKHLASGCYLMAKEVLEQTKSKNQNSSTSNWLRLKNTINKLKYKLMLSDDPNDDDCLFTFSSAEDNEAFNSSLDEPIKFDSLFRIKHFKTRKWLRTGDVNEKDILAIEDAKVDLWFGDFRERDVFSFDILRTEETNEQNTIFLLLPIIQNFIKLIISSITDISEYEMNILFDALSSIKDFCTTIDRQNYFRDIGMIDSIFEMIRVGKSKHEEIIWSKLFDNCYSCISALSRGNIATCAYILEKEYFSELQEHLKEGIGGEYATDALVQIIRDNMEILEKITVEDIENFISILMSTKKKEIFILFLSNICRCDERPVLKNQNNLITLIKKNEGLLTPLFPFPYLKENSTEITVNIDGNEKKLENISHNQHEKQLFLRAMSLLVALCVGKNKDGIDFVITKTKLSTDSILSVIDSEMDPLIRSSFAEILEYCFLDNAKHAELPAISLARPLKKDDKSGAQNNISEYRRKFKDLTCFLDREFEGLTTCLGTDTINVHNLKVFYSLLKILKKCFTYRVYNPYGDRLDSVDIDVKENNGKLEIDKAFWGSVGKLLKSLVVAICKEVKFKDETGDVLKIKQLMCDIVLYILDVIIDFKMSLILSVYSTYLRDKDEQKFGNLSSMIINDNLIEIGGVPLLVSIVNDLLSNINTYQETAQQCLKILLKASNIKSELHKNLLKVSLLTSNAECLKFEKIFNEFTQLNTLLSISSFVGGETSKDFMYLCDLMKSLTESLKEPRVKTAMRNWELHNLILKTLVVNYPSHIKSEIHKLCIELLTEFVKGNEQNQKELFKELKLFISLMGPEIDVSELLTEVVRGNDDNLAKVEPMIIRLYLDKVISCGYKAYHLNFLRALTINSKSKIVTAGSQESFSNQSNQNAIISELKEDYRSLVILYNGEEGMKERARMIAKKDYLKPYSELSYHINLLHLLKDCTRDKVKLAEMGAQSLLSYDDLLSHLTEESIIPPLRDPMLLLLNELYFFTEEVTDQDLTNPKIWALLEKINTEFQEFILNQGKNNYLDEFKLNFKYEIPSSELPSGDNTPVTEDTILLEESPLIRRPIYVNDSYIYKIVLPLIKNFFDKVFNPENYSKVFIHKVESKGAIKKIVSDLLDNLSKLYIQNAWHREEIISCYSVVKRIGARQGIVEDNFSTDLDNYSENNLITISKVSNKEIKVNLKDRDVEGEMLKKYIEDIKKLNFGEYSLSKEERFQQHLKNFVMCLQNIIRVGSNTEKSVLPRDILDTFLLSVGEVDRAVIKIVTMDKKTVKSILKSICKLVLQLICSKNDDFIIKGLQLGITILDMESNRERNQTKIRELLTKKGAFENGEFENFFTSLKNMIRLSILEEKEMRKREKDYVSQQTSSAKNVLRFLQLLCEGHNIESQKMLSEQPFNKVSVNLVSDVCEYTVHLYKYVNKSNVETVTQAIKTLNEFIQGPCIENSNIISSSSRLFTVLNDIIEINIFQDPKKINRDDIELEKQFELLKETIVLLTSMLEGDNKVSGNLLRRQLNMKSLEKQLLRFGRFVVPIGYVEKSAWQKIKYKQDKYEDIIIKRMQKQQDDVEEKKKGEIEEEEWGEMDDIRKDFSDLGASIFILLKYLYPKEIEENTGFEYKYFLGLTGSIEVINRENQIEVVHFIKPPICSNLLESTKKEFKDKIDMESAQTKVKCLLDETYQVFRPEMKHLQQYKDNPNTIRSKIWSVLRYTIYDILVWDIIKNLSFFFSIIINIVVLCSYHHRYDAGIGSPIPVPGMDLKDQNLSYNQGFKYSWLGTFVAVLGLFQIASTIILFAIHISFFSMLNIKKKMGFSRDETWDDKIKQYKEKLELKVILSNIKEVIFMNQIPEEFTFLFSVLKNFIFDYYLLWLIVFFMVSLLGLIVSPLCYCLQLFEVIGRFEATRDIIVSISSNYSKLLVFAALLTFTLTAHAFVIFSVKWDQFVIESIDGEKVQICRSTILCFASMINYFVRGEGFLEDAIDNPTPFDVPRFIFDMIAWFIAVIILLDVLFGLVLDSFSARREESNKKEKEIKEKCFICNNEKTRFDIHANQGITFEKHIKEEHYMWNYVYFLIYLTEKPNDEYTGIEQYIANDKSGIGFFPTLRSRTLEKVESGETEITLEESVSKQDVDKYQINGPQRTALRVEFSGEKATDDLNTLIDTNDLLKFI
ncbi:hypothetical protein ABK040_011745 [Willaertia magna]